MYTHICTGPVLQHISDLLRSKEGRTFQHYDAQALIEALEIVFQNNIFQFGDTYWKQISGTGMGIALAPHGQQYTMQYMKTMYYHGGSQTLCFSANLLMISSESGNAMNALNKIMPYGTNSRTTCNNGTTWNGTSHHSHTPATTWT